MTDDTNETIVRGTVPRVIVGNVTFNRLTGEVVENPTPNKYSQFFTALNEFLQGKKTYAIVIGAIIYLFGGGQGWWVVDDAILAMLGFGGLAALRSSRPAKIYLPILLALCFTGTAQSAVLYLSPTNPPAGVTLAWDRSPTPEVTGYFIYIGSQTRSYTNRVDVGNVAQTTITNLTRGLTHYFTATAYADGLESEWCNEVVYRPNTVPLPPAGLRETNVTVKVSVQSAKASTGPWEPYAELTTAATPGFYRSAVAIEAPDKNLKLRSPKHEAR